MRVVARNSALLLASAVGVSLIVSAPALAVDGTWVNNGGASTSLQSMQWSLDTNWAGSTIAGGSSGDVADFSTLPIAGPRSVIIGADRLVGTLRFGDTDATPNNWTLTDNSTTHTLTLASSSIPTVRVSNATTTIAAVLQGSNGLRKTGEGTLRLTRTNVYTGPTEVAQGTLLVNNSLSAASNVTVLPGATLGGVGGFGNITVQGAIAPGDPTLAGGVGLLRAAAMTWAPGGSYTPQIDSAGDAFDGLTHDHLSLNSINLPGGYQQFIIAPQATNNLVTAFNGFNSVFDWVIASSSNNAFDVGKLFLDTTGLAGLAMPANGGFFLSTSDEGRNLRLSYSYNAVPEATTMILGGLAVMPLILHRRRSRRTA